MCKTTEKDQKTFSEKCRWVVDIAYKQAVAYVWLPEVKSMFAQIVIDCQTKKETISCEYCIAKESCHLQMDMKNNMETMKEPLILVVALLIEA